MILTGKEKALLLLNVLGEQSQGVLSNLSKKGAAFITAFVDDAPEPSQEDMATFLKATLTEIDRVRQARLKVKDSPENSFMAGISEPKKKSSFSDFRLDDPLEKERVYDSSLRTPSKIAGLLSQQKPQIVAFFLSRLDDPLKSDILSVLPEDVASDADACSVEKLPISDRVFEKLYEQLCKKEPGEEDKDHSMDEIELGFSL